MPRLELTDHQLIVHLNFWEALLSFQKSLHIPLKHVRGATEDHRFGGWNLGIRAPGTGIPGIISAGTYLKDGDRQFVFRLRKAHPVAIELCSEKWARIILGVEDAKDTADSINAAIRGARQSP